MSSSYVEDSIRTKATNIKDALGVRHIQAFLMAGALFVNHVQQGNIGISAMALSYEPERLKMYHWRQDPGKMSKGAYFYPLLLSCLIAGYLSTKLDSKLMLLSSTVIGTLVTYITPTLVRTYDWDIFFFIRLIQGAVKGFIRPLVYSQLVRWLPPDELMLIGPVVLSGIFLGNGMILMMGGYLSTGQGGWPSLFYFAGNIGFIWCLAYIGLGSTSPNACFYISLNEKKYIEESLPLAIRSPYKAFIPWKQILTCIPIYALVITQSANNYAIQSIIKIVPKFYQESLQLDVKRDGLVMGIPFVACCLIVYIKYHLLKFLIKRKKISHSHIRHVCNGIGQFGAFYFFVYCAFTENYYVSFAFHCIGMVLSSFQFYGFYMNYIDLAPNYVGLIVGIIVGLAHISSILGPYFSFGLYEYYYEDPSGPQSAFQAKEAIYFFLAMFYLWSGILWELLGSTKVQPFNDIKENEEPEETEYNETEVIKM